jgi:hypothetical protein
MSEPLPPHLFYLERAEHLRALAASEALPEDRDRDLRIAAMYQALADHAVGGAVPTASFQPKISIPAGLLRQA